MKSFDKYIRKRAAKEQAELPDSVKNRMEKTLANLPAINIKPKRGRIIYRVSAMAAGLILVILFMLPNISVSLAKDLEQIPVIGSIVKVITIRNYFYSDDYHEMDIDVPQIMSDNGGAFDLVNKDISELTDALVHKFYEELEEVGNDAHGAVYVDYTPVTNTERWFALEIRVTEAVGSSNTYYKYYNVDRRSGKIVTLGDIAAGENFYSAAEEEIRRQMQDEMQKDDGKFYWIDKSEIGMDFLSLSSEHNFYLDEDGALVIPFDKYEVAPGYMGTPRFKVGKEVIRDTAKDEFADIFNSPSE